MIVRMLARNRKGCLISIFLSDGADHFTTLERKSLAPKSKKISFLFYVAL